jgi:hypothetical protein
MIHAPPRSPSVGLSRGVESTGIAAARRKEEMLMTFRRSFTFMLVASLMLFPVAASAQFDHLTCFKAKDAGKFSAQVTLDAAQDAFDAGVCQVIGKAKLFCVPTSKLVGELLVNKVPQAPLNVPGTTPLPDTVCYKVKCPVATVPDDEIVDQFGSRTLSKFKVSMMCAPAFKAAPTCQLPDPPQCPFNDPCSNGICSTTRGTCTQQADCPLAPNEECCCGGICI